MKIVIFAGGTGRRLWPISRQHLPKQFEPIVSDKSTVALTVDRVISTYGVENIFISTNERYLGILREQLPFLPADNFIGEPQRRDLAAAVGLAMLHVDRIYGPDEHVAIVWGDNYMNDEAAFLRLLKSAENILDERSAEIVFIGETPRFANSNLGWIGIGEVQGKAANEPFFAYESWVYRPSLADCEIMFASGKFVWNTGYFVTTPGFILQAYRDFQPSMWASLSNIGESIGKSTYQKTLHQVYPEIEEASFDDAIVQMIDPDKAVILSGATGWSDPGTLYALKESINPDTKENVEQGLVLAQESRDCLLFNYEEGKLLAVAGLEGMVVVNTEDALLVVHKDDIRLVKELVNNLQNVGLERYS